VANIGVHLGDVLRFVLDAEVEEVAAMLDVGARAGEEMETLALAVLRFEGGALAHVTASQRSPKPLNDLVIHGTRGRIDGRGLGSPGWLMRHGTASVDMRIATDAREERFDYEVDGVFERTLAAFADAVRAAAEPEPSGLDGLRSAELMEAIAESARSGRTVRPAEVSAWQ
jgi:1,5-anhydro-D-fructose reductase (1,5-anhydro-D-mannitol-forming)